MALDPRADTLVQWRLVFPRHHWWAVAVSEELGHAPLSIRRFGRKLCLWRDGQGKAHCTDDLCPHRGASLAAGKVVGDCIACPFHAFEFDGRGHCVLAPSEGAHREHRPALDVAAYPVREHHGILFIWWGDGPPVGDPPWFDRITDDYVSSGFSVVWKTNYLRAIEVQLDWAHLPYIHSNSIGRGFEPATEVEFTLEDDSLITWDRRFEDEAGEPRFYLHLMFPNIWMNPVQRGMFGFLAIAPIDEDNTRVYVRFYQNRVRLPVLRSVFAWFMNRVNGLIANQDKWVVETQPTAFTPDLRNERLTASDRPIAEYRKEMRRRMRASDGTGIENAAPE